MVTQYAHIPVVDKNGVRDRSRYFRVKVGSTLHDKLLKLNDGKLPEGIIYSNNGRN